MKQIIIVIFLVVVCLSEHYTYGKLKRNKLNSCYNEKIIRKKNNVKQNIWKQDLTTTNSSFVTTNQISATKQGPCNCGGGICACCSRLLFNVWKQTACVRVSYDPDEFSFTAKILMNDVILYTRSVSGKNPRPICVPVPRFPIVRACLRFYNIYFQGRNVHACMNMEGKFRDTILFKVELDCMRFGSKGLAFVKPEDGGGLGQIVLLPEGINEGDEYGDDDYDEEDDDDDDDDDDEGLFDY
ncbi:uncharacterized protein LOC127288064 [Leptopilina boulardi]|uniref:uncharacterized protein LOC127288064 n=1 Tax=Leptopilina boulardi TaxID=63433 RepID=UPI0021F51064|nr:uncharacterized protein LOC127288064 [Leptopilina boulardi]